MQETRKTAEQILELIKEAEQYSKYREGLSKKISRLFQEYQKGNYTYFQYKELLSKLARGKSKRDWEEYYTSYLYQIMKKIELLNDKLFYNVHEDKSWQDLDVKGSPQVRVEESQSGKKKRTAMEIPRAKEAEAEIPAKKAEKKKPKAEEMPPAPGIEEEKTPVKLKVPSPSIDAERQPFFIIALWRDLKHWYKLWRQKPISSTILEGTKKLFRLKEEGYLGEKVTVPKEVVTFRKKPAPLFEEKVSKSAIAEEATRIKRIIEQRRELEPYKPSFFGSIANLTIRRASFYLIDSFPEFFRYLYNSLRLANIKMLSNTYVNVMVFISLLAMIVTFPLFIIFFTLLENPFALILIKSVLLSLVAGAISFFGFYYYPFGKLSQRAKNMNANLPFAINHMSAVAASGVPPVKMFRLIAQSQEYGEISKEVEKIVEYVSIFGYDLITALKSVAAITPSPEFKEYLDGMVSNVESGSDIKVYMNEKSKEALLEYELERQKYAETISTYSDIYTGILIAAPLFFVAALSLVGILGGAVGGIPIDALIVMGTYIIIPLLNIGFIIFLQFTQPEI